MLHISNISKSYGPETILTDISFIVNSGERVGLVGPNGSGKTTLLRIITGLESPDSGQVRFDPPGLSVGYLTQALVFEPGETMQQSLARVTAEHSRAWAEMQQAAAAMAAALTPVELTASTTAYTEAEARFEAAGGYELEPRLEAILAGLNLADIPRDLPVERLSGGQKTRLGLAGLLIQQPRLLLLDEPTNHLDLDALIWLEGWLERYDGTVLIVSHDRTFLDHMVSRILELDPVTHRLAEYTGNYDDYALAKAWALEKQWGTWKDQQAEIQRLQADVQRTKEQARNTERATTNDHTRRLAKKVAKKAKARERRLQRLLESEERVAKPDRHWQMKLDLANDDAGARRVLSLENVGMAFDGRRLFSEVSQTLTHGQRVALIGPNGEGKTTLLRLITGELEPTTGQIRLGAGVKLGYFAQEQEQLDPASTPYETIRAVAVNMDQTETRSFLHFFLFAGDDAFIPVGSLSYGERARLMLALLVAQGCNFLLLDEPVNHLDIPSRERFETALNQFPGTILAVVHDRAFISRVATNVWEMRHGRVRELFDFTGSTSN
ncbi:MAG: ATP-binding cassette domain-containing protein [Anaerolineae bacterium]|nr:ATP-binding cassette domain-containing protein [Anaerolineae bacterium]